MAIKLAVRVTLYTHSQRYWGLTVSTPTTSPYTPTPTHTPIPPPVPTIFPLASFLDHRRKGLEDGRLT